MIWGKTLIRKSREIHKGNGRKLTNLECLVEILAKLLEKLEKLRERETIFFVEEGRGAFFVLEFSRRK